MTPILCVSLISMFSHCGDLEAALQLYQQTKQQVLKTDPAAFAFHHNTMQHVPTDEITYTCLLAACANHADLANGKKIHQELATSGIKLSPMYGACGELNTALQIYYQTREEPKPTDVTYICLLSACSNSVMPNTGKLIHAELLNSQLQISLPLHNALITFYGCCGLIDEASSIVEKLLDSNIPLKLDTWNAIIAAYSHNGYAKQALQIFDKMQHYNIMPDSFTFASVLCLQPCH